MTDGGPLRFNSHDKSSDAILEAQGIEIEQETYVVAAHAEIREDLRFMDRQKFIYLPMQLDRQPNDLLSQFTAKQHHLLSGPPSTLALLRVNP